MLPQPPIEASLSFPSFLSCFHWLLLLFFPSTSFLLLLCHLPLPSFPPFTCSLPLSVFLGLYFASYFPFCFLQLLFMSITHFPTLLFFTFCPSISFPLCFSHSVIFLFHFLLSLRFSVLSLFPPIPPCPISLFGFSLCLTSSFQFLFPSPLLSQCLLPWPLHPIPPPLTHSSRWHKKRWRAGWWRSPCR